MSLQTSAIPGLATVGLALPGDGSGAYQVLQQVPPAYLYAQYSDDADLQAFFAAYNALAQGYLEWFTDTPLGVYTNSNISGPLLDWIAEGIYGVSRPVIATEFQYQKGAYNTQGFNTSAFNGNNVTITGTAQQTTDDYYKRVLTWIFYRNDGQQFSMTWLKKRIARFLYGSDGSDVSVGQINNVSIVQKTFVIEGNYNSSAFNSVPYNVPETENIESIQLTAYLPTSTAASIFADFLAQNIIPFPLQVTLLVEAA